MKEELNLSLSKIGSRHLDRFYKRARFLRELIESKELSLEIQLHWLNLCVKDDQESRDLLREFLEEKKKELDGCYQTVKVLFGL